MKIDRTQAEIWAGWFAALGEPTRILILNLLATAGRPLSVGEIVEGLDVGQSTVSHHLGILAETCFVLVEPVGNSRMYRINERCLTCFPSAAELVMGHGPTAAPWRENAASTHRPRSRRRS